MESKVKSKWLRWVPGRQGAEYQKKLLIRFGIPGIFGLDTYLLKFEPNCNLPEHVDKVDKGRHFRLNFIYKGKGDFKCEKTIIRTKRFVLFRPDKYRHLPRQNQYRNTR